MQNRGKVSIAGIAQHRFEEVACIAGLRHQGLDVHLSQQFLQKHRKSEEQRECLSGEQAEKVA